MNKIYYMEKETINTPTVLHEMFTNRIESDLDFNLGQGLIRDCILDHLQVLGMITERCHEFQLQMSMIHRF